MRIVASKMSLRGTFVFTRLRYCLYYDTVQYHSQETSSISFTFHLERHFVIQCWYLASTQLLFEMDLFCFFSAGHSRLEHAVQIALSHMGETPPIWPSRKTKSNCEINWKGFQWRIYTGLDILMLYVVTSRKDGCYRKPLDVEEDS